MSLFVCEQCGCIENTATSRYWMRGDGPALCSLCDPKLGRWHGIFPRDQADMSKVTLRPNSQIILDRG